MYIIDRISVDTSGRINIGGLFGGKAPRDVGFAYDTSKQEIVIKPLDEAPYFTARKVDSENRMSLASWVIDEFGKNFYLVINEQKQPSLKVKDFFR